MSSSVSIEELACDLIPYQTVATVSSMELSTFITASTTAAEFSLFRSKRRSYELWHGDEHSVHALMHAAGHGNTALIELIVEKGGRDLLELSDRCGLAALHQAAFFHQYRAVLKLILLGAPVDCADHDGDTPLSIALKSDAPNQLIKLLIYYSSDLLKLSSPAVQNAVELCRCYRLLAAACSDQGSPFHLLSKERVHALFILWVEQQYSCSSKEIIAKATAQKSRELWAVSQQRSFMH
jgi:hypothetical protein